MSKVTKKKPLALTIDDDPEFNKIIRLLLMRLGLEVKTTSTPEEFLKELKTSNPALCLIDLNFGGLNTGFTIIKAVRSVLGPELPLIVVSRFSDRQSIAHSLEIGANDFIVKPVDQELLASKLNRYVQSDELENYAKELTTVPENEGRAYVSVEVEVSEVDEFGIRIVAPYLIPKGTAIYLDHPFLHQVTNQTHPIFCSVTSTWVEPDGKSAAMYVEFDENDEELRAAVRRWLASNQNLNGDLVESTAG